MGGCLLIGLLFSAVSELLFFAPGHEVWPDLGQTTGISASEAVAER